MENFISEIINGFNLLDIYVVIFLFIFFGYFISLPLSLYINVKLLLNSQIINYKRTSFLGILGLLILLFIIGGSVIFYSSVLFTLTTQKQEIIGSILVVITLLLISINFWMLGDYIRINLSKISKHRKLVSYFCSIAFLLPLFAIIFFLVDKSYQDIVALFEIWSYTNFVFLINAIFLIITYSYLKKDQSLSK